MGAGASTVQAPPPKFQRPVVREDEDGHPRSLFFCVPMDEKVKAKAPQVLLEVGARGFRLLRTSSEEPLFDFPFAQIHSWGHLPNRFSFKFYEEKSKSVVLYTFDCKLVDPLLKAIHSTIDVILTHRKTKSMPDAELDELRARLAAAAADGRIAILQAACATNFFTSAQALKLVETMDSTFDQIEAAAMLHFCLVDQNHFSRVISSMDPGDKDNVLHRVTTEKHRRNSHRPKTSMKYAQSPLSNSEVNAASNDTTSSPPQPPIPSPDNKHPSPPPQQQPDRPPSPSEGVSPGKPDI